MLLEMERYKPSSLPAAMHIHALSARKELKTWVAVISLTLLASAAWADPQSEISVYRKSYGLSAVTADAKLLSVFPPIILFRVGTP
jgi:hypothetical protein